MLPRHAAEHRLPRVQRQRHQAREDGRVEEGAGVSHVVVNIYGDESTPCVKGRPAQAWADQRNSNVPRQVEKERREKESRSGGCVDATTVLKAFPRPPLN